MSDEASTTGTETAATEQTAPEPQNTGVSEATTVEQLPPFAQKMISDLRQEAAKHRTGKVEAVEATKSEVAQGFEAKLAESNTAHEATKGQLAQTSLEMAKLTAAIDAGIPTDRLKSFAKLLQGSNAEELQAHATEVLNTFGGGLTGAVDPSQGLNKGAEQTGDGDDFASFILGHLDRNS